MAYMKTIVYAFCLASARSVWYHLGLWLYWASVERSIPSLLIREPEVEDLFDYCSTHKNSRMKRKYIYIYAQGSRVPRLTQRIRIGVGIGMKIYDEDKEGDGDGYEDDGGEHFLWGCPGLEQNNGTHSTSKLA